MTKHLLPFLWLGLFFTACHSSPAPNAPSKDLVLATGIPIGEMQPYSSREGIGSNLVDLLYRPLFRLTPEGAILPDLAKTVSWDDANQALRVELQSPAAEDVRRSVEKAKSLVGGGFYEALIHLEKVEVVSPREVLFKLQKFDRAFLSVVEHLPIVLFSQSPQTSGEFEIESATPEQVTLIRKQEAPGKMKKLRVQVISSPRRAIREMVAGNVDVLLLASRGDFEVLKDNPELKFGEMRTNIVYTVLENRNGKPSAAFADWATLSRLIDREALVASLSQEGVVPAIDPDPLSKEGIPSQGSPPPQGLTTKQRRVLSLLGEQPRDLLIARVLKRRLEEIGMELELRALDSRSFGEEVIFKKNFDLVLFPINIKDPIVTNFLAFHTAKGPNSLNYSGYSNPALDALLEAARYSRGDAEAKQSYRQAMQALREDPPGLFLFWLKMPIVYRQSCSGFKFSSNEFFSSLKDVRCEPSAAN